MLLVGDIGGTKTVLALGVWNQGRVCWEYQERFLNRDFSRFEEVLAFFLQKNKKKIVGASFGIAGPITGEVVSLSNCPWKLDLNALKRFLSLEHVFFLNDLNMCARGIAFLSPEDKIVLQEGNGFNDSQTQVVIAAGTGLGHAILCPVSDKKQAVLSTEAGHVSFAPRNEEEIQMLRFLWKRWPRVSIERLVSGAGIVALYEYFSEKENKDSSPILSLPEPASQISQLALEEKDETCQNALQTFVQLYGAQAGDFALSTLAQGGVYLAGGIPPKILPALQKADFLNAFYAKGRFSTLMKEIPVAVVVNTEVSLLGAASIFR